MCNYYKDYKEIADRINDLESLEGFTLGKIKQTVIESFYIDANIVPRLV